jgi:L-threonylcarbamoyladenylate synthase
MIELREAGTGRLIASGDHAFARAGALLDAGGILIHPTSAVYGIGGRPTPAVDAEIARLKGRSTDQPLILVCSDVRELRRTLPRVRWPGGAVRLAERFWPGPLTLVLPNAEEDAGDGATPGRGIAVRVDPHPVLNRILLESGGVMTSTSLNLAGERPARTRRDLMAALERLGPAQIDIAFIDVGDLPPGRPSTIVEVTDAGARLIREGDVEWADILSVVSDRAAHDGETRKEP